MHCLELVYNKSENSRLEQKSIIIFWWLRNANSVKFTKEYVMRMEKQILLKTMFTNGLNMGLSL